MPTLTEIQCIVIVEAAASATYGLVVRVSDPYLARTRLYAARKHLGDPSLAGLQIRVSPDDSEHELWIVNRERLTLANVQTMPPSLLVEDIL